MEYNISNPQVVTKRMNKQKVFIIKNAKDSDYG